MRRLYSKKLAGDIMRVIEAISDMNIGGAGRLLLTRLKESDRERIETFVILPRGSALARRVIELGVRVCYVDGCRDTSFELGAVFEIMKIIRQISPDIINCHGCMSARIAALLCGVPVRIYTRHCTYPIPVYQRIAPMRWLIGGAGRLLSNHAIAVAEAAKGDLVSLGYPKNNISVIINGVEGLRKYSAEERYRARRELALDGCFVVGICARLERCKDHESFLRSARILALSDPQYRFIVMGGGSLEGELKCLAESLGISDRVIFTGFVKDVEKYFNCFDLNVNCSIGTETSSLALSEGMSIALPAVASSYGGNTYMIRDGENGYIYQKGDFYQLAQKIKEIAEDRALYGNMSNAAYARYVTELNSKKMTAETEKLYFSLYNSHVKNKRAFPSKAGE